jgi:hypothetical protein
MASDTKNVKLGVCTVYYGGVDLGYTQGGVTVTVKTNTHPVNVDQFGKTTINELIMQRDVTVKTPLAETTLENLVSVMPGATLVNIGGSVATGSVTVASLPVDGDTLTVNGAVFTFRAVPQFETDIAIEADVDAQATAIAAALASVISPAVSVANYVAAAAAVNITYGTKATAGNNFSLATSVPAKLTVSGVKLSGGADPTDKHVDVTTGVGTDLLSIAKELRLHPVSKAINDYSEDFVIPLAATSGALNFVYEVEKERIYDVDFTGYPDPTTKKLFSVGTAPA